MDEKISPGQNASENLSTWGIGGPCKYFVQVFDQTQLISAIRRKFTQPVGERSAGSVFRSLSDSNISAAEFIERAGLKGYRIGEAMVSKKHANFFKNCGGATSQEMLELIRLVRRQFLRDLVWNSRNLVYSSIL
ncbi:uncharacterized protein LOC111408699 [Olea europaea var. sylvestris]|uniref:uncharacterized protein LOC111408699 n=1 Tax=Olea europaea var. sylvestris TaxID=158386 RepID=UPI000C1D56AA|nr:uncharacterized protein LOC111408699 [Olea europaea var. sylvestris]